MTRFLLALLAVTALGLACNRATDPPPTEQPAQATAGQASASQASIELGAPFVLQAPAAEVDQAIAPATAIAPLAEKVIAPVPVPAVQPPSTEVEPPDPSTTAPANAPADSAAATGPYANDPGAMPALWRNVTPMRC